MAGKKKSTTSDSNVDDTTITKKKVVRRKKGEIGLYETIKKKTNIDKVLDKWIQEYESDAEQAVWNLLVLIFDCAGAVTTITFKQFKDYPINKAAKIVCDQEDSVQFPLSSKRSKNFLENFNEFWLQIIIKNQESILFDGYLLNMLVLWLIETAQGKRRGLRYASTLAAIQITTSMIEIAINLRNQLNAVSRQLGAETSSTNRHKQLKENQTNIRKKLKVLDDFIMEFFKNLFHTRFKDSLPEIRSMCLVPLPLWILRYSFKLLNNECLKYFGWALNDFATEPRLAAVRGLSILFADGDNANKFDYFSQRFKHRIIEIAFSDKIPAITVEGIHLVSTMSPYDFLDEPDVLKVCKLYQIDHPDISKAAGSLIFNKFLSGVQEKIDSVISAKKKKSDEEKSSSQILHLRENQLNILLEFLEKTAHSDIPYYLVLALWETKAKDLFVDWSFWVDYLESIESKNISDKQLGIIINFLNSSIRIATGDKYRLFGSSKPTNNLIATTTDVASTQANTQQAPPTPKKKGKPGRKTGRKPASSKKSDDESDSENEEEITEDQQPQQQIDPEELLDEEVCNQVTTNFLNILPELITQYRADSVISQGLIEIAKYFVLDCYVTLRAQSKYTELLEAICSIFLTQPRIELINVISETLDHLINNGKTPSQLETASKNALHSLHNELVDTLRLAKIRPPQSSQIIPSTDDQNQQEDQIFQVIVTLRKLDSLGKRFYFSDEKYASLIHSFTGGDIHGIEVETQDDSDNIIMHSLSITSQLLIWSFFRAIPEKSYHINPTDLDVIQSFYLFVSRSISHLKNSNITHTLKHFIYTTLVDTRSIFSPVLSLTNLNNYNIGLPIEKLLAKTIEDLIKTENEYSIKLLKVEYLKTQQSNLEKKKIAIENRSKRLTALKTKKSDTGAAVTTDDDTTAAPTTNSERDDTDTDGNIIEHQILESDIEMVNSFVFDNKYSKRMEELAITICNSIRFSFTSEILLRTLLEQIAISSSKPCTDLIREFIKEKPQSNPKVELDIFCEVIANFHKICISEEISTNKELQHHMFSRFRSLCQYLINDYIKNENTLKDSIEHFLNFALKNPTVDKMDEFLEIIQFLCSKLSEKSSIEILKKRIVFPNDYIHIEIIKNIYDTIEFQTISNMDIETGSSKKNMKKQQLKFSRKPTTKKRRRPSKNVSSEEEEDEEEEDEEEEDNIQNSEEENKNITTNDEQEEEEEILQDDIDPDLQQQSESSEYSSDYETKETSKKKLKQINN
ncbi:hypothetical protein DICPUDRAFT_45033 [Dictyostelium purpureum]|uniref:SCD domain-containing protein n=1 Tax=Dictyostelium purpureum TaxID=5786 RepID=F0Z8J2_DICPU|nr:uncharacterized protein DICPUDRAFT_45033 [Dictyostelium purpureum]EGC39769.1 hypothetical protein DICPUDRAFT_45033 [Dictyostelium purpureum]|eukprot:XP_003283755.1 hypothetical protein DICPUDRAFT_45033 [Dictyostelium purpureum]